MKRRKLRYTLTRKYRLQKFGMTNDDYWKLLESQDFKCASCGGDNEDGKLLSVDHDHLTGKVRGLLCHRCNITLGTMRDDLEKLKGLVRYLYRNSTHLYFWTE